MVYYEIDYASISKYYKNIILYILNNLSYACAVEYNAGEYIRTDHSKEEYEEEYLSAYGYLQRATWRLSELDEMTDFYDEPDFFYFGMNNLSSARHRIQHYLEATTWTIFKDLNYHKFDDLVMDYYQPIRLGEEGFEEYYEISHEKWEYYWRLHSTAQMKHYVKQDCTEIRDKLDKFINYLDTVDYQVLKEHLKELEDLNYHSLDFIFYIPHVPFKNKIKEE